MDILDGIKYIIKVNVTSFFFSFPMWLLENVKLHLGLECCKRLRRVGWAKDGAQPKQPRGTAGRDAQHELVACVPDTRRGQRAKPGTM